MCVILHFQMCAYTFMVQQTNYIPNLAHSYGSTQQPLTLFQLIKKRFNEETVCISSVTNNVSGLECDCMGLVSSQQSAVR